MGTYSLADVMIEHLDDEILVCDSSHGIALQITGEAADVLRQFEETGSLEGAPEEVVADLVKAGVLVPAEDGAGLSRRVLLASGVGVVGGGIMALALPAATAAASVVAVAVAMGVVVSTRARALIRQT